MEPRRALRPKKEFGQHFLIAAHAIRAIVAEALASPAPRLLEIGPGTGVLTAPLLEDGRPLWALELDPEACALLTQKFADRNFFHLLPGDAVNQILPPGAAWSVVGNLPYNAATAILGRFLTEPIPWTRMVLMFQREVGDKLTGKPATKAYGPLSVLAQLCCRMTRLLRLGPGAFDPPPKVESVVLRFDPLPEAPPVAERQALLAFLHRSFAHRRKTLLNNWQGWLEPETTKAILESAGLGLNVRAEAIPVALWPGLYDRINALNIDDLTIISSSIINHD